MTEGRMNRMSNENGMVLITVIILMAIVALIGVIAIDTSTVEIQISGNLKKSIGAFGGAEAGTDVAVPVIERSISAGELDPTTITGGSVDPAPLGGVSLATEITGGANYHEDLPGSGENSDLVMNSLNGTRVDVDIDRMYSYNLPGGAMEFASGYEGVGAAAAGGGIGVLYRITGQGSN